MKLLVLGGTRFVGRWIVEIAAARGHNVTLLHRGIVDAGSFPEHAHIIADRTRSGDLAPLEGQKWDAVIDCSGYSPADVELSGRLLCGSVGRYLFVSTAAVYAGEWGSSWNEDTPLVAAGEESYGGRKRACEQLLQELYGQRCTITRPSIIVGPADPDDRLGYWLRRIERGGHALLPGVEDQIVQMIDARDHASFTVSLVERDLAGCFNVDGTPTLVREVLDGWSALFPQPGVTWTRVPGRVLAEFGLRREDLPGHVPFWSPDDSITARLDITRALAAGLSLRPIADTARSVIASERFRDVSPRYLTEERESELLRQWRARCA